MPTDQSFRSHHEQKHETAEVLLDSSYMCRSVFSPFSFHLYQHCLYMVFHPKQVFTTCIKQFSFFCVSVYTCTDELDLDADDSEEYWQQSHDYRQPGEVSCDSRSFHRPTQGSGLLAKSYSVLQPDTPMGDPIFKIVNIVSDDCTTLDPLGFNIQKTKRANTGQKQEISKSLTALSRKRQESITASVSVRAGPVSVGASMDSSLSSGQSRTSAKSRVYILTEIENVDNVAAIGTVTKPPLSAGFLSFWNRHAPPQLSSKKFVKKIMRGFSHYIKKAELGSQFSEVSSNTFLWFKLNSLSIAGCTKRHASYLCFHVNNHTDRKSNQRPL